MKLLGIQNAAKQPPQKEATAPFKEAAAPFNSDSTAEASVQGKASNPTEANSADSVPRAYNAAADMLERHDRIASKVKARLD